MSIKHLFMDNALKKKKLDLVEIGEELNSMIGYVKSMQGHAITNAFDVSKWINDLSFEQQNSELLSPEAYRTRAY